MRRISVANANRKLFSRPTAAAMMRSAIDLPRAGIRHPLSRVTIRSRTESQESWVQTFQRQYEALRAVFVEAEPIERVAARFGYKPSARKSMTSRFRADCRRGVTTPFFSTTDEDDHSGPPTAKTSHAPNRPKSPTAQS